MKRIKWYYGYSHKGGLLIIGEDKDLVDYYMSIIRKLKDNEYYIDEKYSENYIIDNMEINTDIDYEKKLAQPFFDMYLPQIDIDILNYDFNEFNNILKDSNKVIKEFLICLIRFIKIPKKNFIIKTIMNACLIIDKFIEKKKSNNKFKKSYIMSHILWNCDIIEYLNLLKKYDEIESINSKYKSIIGK